MGCNNNISIDVDDLPITTEAKVFYLSNCLWDADSVEVQLQDGVDLPKIRLDFEYSEQYFEINDLAKSDMDLIVDELMEAGVVDEET